MHCLDLFLTFCCTNHAHEITGLSLSVNHQCFLGDGNDSQVPNPREKPAPLREDGQLVFRGKAHLTDIVRELHLIGFG